MASEYLEKAIESVADYLRTNLPAELRQVETDQSLSANALPDPVQVLTYQAFSDLTAPSLQVYCTSAQQTNPNTGLFNYAIDVVLITTHNANLEAGAAKMRRYVTAILRCVGKAPSLGSTVSGAFVTDIDPLLVHGDDGIIRHLCGFGLDVTVHNPLTC